jgi:hypothetical protein
MVLPLPEVTLVSATGVRYMNPEIVLLFKAKTARAKDEAALDATSTCPQRKSTIRFTSGAVLEDARKSESTFLCREDPFRVSYATLFSINLPRYLALWTTHRARSRLQMVPDSVIRR